MFAAPVLIDRSMTNFSAWGGKGNRIKSKMAPRYREKWTSITTVRDQYLSSATSSTTLIFHYPLPLSRNLRNDEDRITLIAYCRYPVPFMVTDFNYKTLKKKKLFDRILFYSFRIFNAIFESIEEVAKKFNSHRQIG
jgi:hypothetical protein